MRWPMVLRRGSAGSSHRFDLFLWRRRQSSIVSSPRCRHHHSFAAAITPAVELASARSSSNPSRFMSVALPKSLKRTLRKKRTALFYVDLGSPCWSASSLSTLPCCSSLESTSGATTTTSRQQRQRLNWNPLSLGCRQLIVRYNTQPAHPPSASPSKPPSSALLLTSSLPPPTVPATSNARRAFLVDTLQVMRRLEAQELNQRQAEAITAVVTSVLNDSLESVAQSYTSKSDMQKTEMMHDASLSKFKAEMQSSLEHHFATLQRESERLRTDMEKMRSELRYEIDKVQANQRLDLNLERGHIRDELNKQQTETSNLTNKLDREIHGLKTQLEAGKYEVIKYCIGTIVSLTAVGLGLLRIIM